MKAKIKYNKFFKIGKVDRRMGGSFVEHLNRSLYGGVYEENHSQSDRIGFRNDVKDLVKEFGVTLLRYPGGNFVSSYNWKDGIGPRKNRPVRFDLAWGCRETNQVGIDEFAKYSSELGAELMLTVNLGTGTPKEAAELVEYCNIEQKTFYSDLRRVNGSNEPYKVRLWCVGNEMDGRWQIGQMDAQTYAKAFRETAKMMRSVDAEIQLVACGSCTNEFSHKSFGHWDRFVLEEAYDWMDYLSLHRYYGYDISQSLAYPRAEKIQDAAWMPVDLENMICTIGAAIQYVKGIRRTKHMVYISFDELGVLPKKAKHSTGIEYDTFTQYDAVLFGGLLCTLLNHANLVKVCCQALLVNENGMFSVFPNAETIIQPIAYPFKNFVDCIDGIVLQQTGEWPRITTEHYGPAPCASAACVYHEAKSEIHVLVSNFSLSEPLEIEFSFEGFKRVKLQEHQEIFSSDPEDKNSETSPGKIRPIGREIKDGCKVLLKPHSWNKLRYSAV